MTRIFFIVAIFFMTGVFGQPRVAQALDKETFVASVLEEVLKNSLLTQNVGEQVRVWGVRLLSEGAERAYTAEEFAHAHEGEQFSLTRFDANTGNRRFDAVLRHTDGRAVKIRGRFDVMVEVPVPVRLITRGELIWERDVTWHAVPAHKLNRNMVDVAEGLIGKEARRRLVALKPVHIKDVQKPIVVQKGNLIPMVFRSHNMELKTLGYALDNGSEGDIIRVRNARSGAVVKALVQNTGEAEVNIVGRLVRPKMAATRGDGYAG